MLVSMKRMTLAALRQEEAQLLHALQKLGAVEIISMNDAPEDDEALSNLETQANKLSVSIKFLSRHSGKKKGMFSMRPLMKLGELEASQDEDSSLDQAQQCEQRLAAINAEKTALSGIIEQMTPWKALEVPVEKLVPTRSTVLLAGLVPLKQEAQLLQNEMFVNERVVIELYGEIAGTRAVFACCLDSDLDEFHDSINEIAWVDATFPKMKGTAEAIMGQCQDKLDALDDELKELEQSISKLAAKTEELQGVYDATCIERDRMAAKQEYTYTQRAFVLEGWVREDAVQSVAAAVAGVTDAYSLEFRDPAEDEVPPSVVQNNRLVWPFEMVTNLYSRPATTGRDPTPWMAPFFFIFFGMMVSDAGYGVILAIFATLFSLKMRPRGMVKNLGWILALGGISTVIWGALFGGWLGISLTPIWFSPMEEPIMMLGVCYSLGLIHIFTGMGLKMATDIKHRRWVEAFCDTGLWYVLIIGLIFLLAPMLGLPASLSQVGTIMSIVGAAGLVLTQGRHKKGLGKLTSGLLSLYDITSYLSDILSYSRLFALGLATGVIGMVINTVGAMLGTNIIGYVFMIVIFIGGHLFNIAINTLGAYVHSSRLQYIEFFGKFYESGGRVFKPLCVKTKYVDISEI